MNIIIYLIAGAIVGYIASRIMKTSRQQGLLLDIVVGVAGAFLAGYFISPLLGIGTINDAITLPTMLVTLLGSVILLLIFKMVRLSAPKETTFWIAVVLAVLGVLGHEGILGGLLGGLASYSFWLAVIGFIVLALGNLLRGV